MAIYGGPYSNWTGDLPSATFDGTTTHIGSNQRFVFGAWKGTVNGGYPNYRTIKLYVNNMNSRAIAVAIYPNVRWAIQLDDINPTGYSQGYIPASLSTRLKEILNAPQTFEETNIDDSFSLRDIVEFHPEMSESTLPLSFSWPNENTIAVNSGTFLFSPEPGWAFEFSDSSGATVTVTSNDTFATGGTTELIAIQHTISPTEIETYSGDMTNPDDFPDPFVYADGYAHIPRETIESESMTGAFGGTWTVELVRYYDNIETDADEAGYQINRRVTGSIDSNYINDRWFTLATIANQEEAESRFQTVVNQTQENIDNDQTNIDIETAAALEGTEVWSETVEPNDFTDWTEPQIYSLVHANVLNRYLLKRGTIPLEVIDAPTVEDAIIQAQTTVHADANPEAETYPVHSWKEYIDSLDAYRLDSTKYPLADWNPFRGVQIVGGHDYIKPGGHRPVDETSKTLMLHDYDPSLGTRPSGALRIYLRSGYAVRFKMTTENAHYFFANMEGVSGHWDQVLHGPTEAVVLNPKGDSEVEIVDPPSTLNPNDVVYFTLKARKHDDAYIEVDIDHDVLSTDHWTNVSAFKISSLGEVITVDSPDSINDELFISVESVTQFSRRDANEEEEEEPEEEEEEEGGMGDWAFGAVAAIVGILLITLLIRATRGGGE